MNDTPRRGSTEPADRPDDDPLIRREDYAPPGYVVEEIRLTLELGFRETLVHSRLRLRRNVPQAELFLDGDGLDLVSVRMDGQELPDAAFSLSSAGLRIHDAPDTATLDTVVRIHPDRNDALEGLYQSSGGLFTQCEPEGFRRITFFTDRPDVLAPCTTTLVGSPDLFPVMLANGNPAGSGRLADGRSWARWYDPFPKPSYLFAVVAGDLRAEERSFRTVSGRDVALRMFVEERNAGRCDFALDALEQSMRWDEERYGREYDLDVLMMVAVDDFNMGAMENKGLMLFNSRCVLADSSTATDADHRAILAVVAHEYFHNWTGNRVTCRDWFQLCLKEGLTVFREQQFAAEVGSPGAERIDDVEVLRERQFREDAGPTAHAVRPDAYRQINNFYTATVYEKGAEVVRMLRLLLGPAAFRAGMDLYFDRFDGFAATIDDFLEAMADASGQDLEQFSRWYSQRGTPRLRLRREYDAGTGVLTVGLSQEPANPELVPDAQPLPVPVAVAMFTSEGTARDLRLIGEDGAVADVGRETVLALRADSAEFRFADVGPEDVLSPLRGFSAPVILDSDLTSDELRLLGRCETDGFQRWFVLRELVLRELVDAIGADRDPDCSGLVEALGGMLSDPDADPVLTARVATLPSDTLVAERLDTVNPEAIRRVLAAAEKQLVRRPGGWSDCFESLPVLKPYHYSAREAGIRSLRAVCLRYLVAGGDPAWADRAAEQSADTECLTTAVGGLLALRDLDCPQRTAAFSEFGARSADEPLVVDRWLALRATSQLPETLADVRSILDGPLYHRRNPNRVRAVLATFALRNEGAFHRRDGAGYRILADEILAIDPANPSLAARLAAGLAGWQRYQKPWRGLMEAELRRVAGQEGLSRDVSEMVQNSLGAMPG